MKEARRKKKGRGEEKGRERKGMGEKQEEMVWLVFVGNQMQVCNTGSE